MDAIRRPLVIAAAIVIVIALAIELGSRLWIDTAVGVPANTPRPGLGIPSLAALDALLTMTLVVVALAAAGVSPHLISRTSGCLTIIVSILTILGSLIALFAAIALLLLMIGLLLATPFGTLAYLAVFGSFERGPAQVTLGILIILKLASALLAFLGNPHVLKSKSLIFTFLLSIGLTLLLIFLHNLPPRILASITDAIGAIIAFIVAIIWAIFYLVGGVIGLLGNLKLPGKKSGER